MDPSIQITIEVIDYYKSVRMETNISQHFQQPSKTGPAAVCIQTMHFCNLKLLNLTRIFVINSIIELLLLMKSCSHGLAKRGLPLTVSVNENLEGENTANVRRCCVKNHRVPHPLIRIGDNYLMSSG